MNPAITAEIARLSTYKTYLEGRVLASVPEKHTGHSETYKQYLSRELETVKSKIESLKAVV